MILDIGIYKCYYLRDNWLDLLWNAFFFKKKKIQR